MDPFSSLEPMTGAPLSFSPAPQVKPAKPARVFTAKETALAWVSGLLGYLFCRAFPAYDQPVTALVFLFFLFAFAFLFFGKRKRKMRSLFYPVSALILSCSLFFSASPVLLFFVFAYACGAFVLFCQTGADTALEGRAGSLYAFETFQAFFVSPFQSIGAVVDAIGRNKGGEKAVRILLILLAGIGVTFIPTVVVAGLLSFDSNFTHILNFIRETLLDGILPRFWSIVFGVPVGMYLYAALYTSAHPLPDGCNAEACVKLQNQMKIAPSLFGAAAFAPLLFLYGVFIVAQADYYKAVLTASLPGAFTFAEFARDGFFRLCAVAAINAAALVALRVFTKKTKSGTIAPFVKICTVILSLVTIIISVTAISQMAMYVSAFGLTRLRLYTLWFMGLLILLFLVTILKQIIEKVPFAAICIALAVLSFGLLAIPDSDALIASHNYNCFVEGTSEEIDISYLTELGPSAIPTLCRLANNEKLTGSDRQQTLYAIGCFAATENQSGLQGLTLPRLRAKSAYHALDRKTKRAAAAVFEGINPREKPYEP